MQSRAIVSAIRTELKAQATPERAEGEKRYLKSDLDFLGATVPMTRKAVKRVASNHPDLSRAELRQLVKDLSSCHASNEERHLFLLAASFYLFFFMARPSLFLASSGQAEKGASWRAATNGVET